MSHEYNASYYIEQERIRQERERRRQEAIRNRVITFLSYHKENYNKMLREGLDNYVSLEQVQNDIRRIEDLLYSDPYEANRISFRVSDNIRSLSDMAYEIKADFKKNKELVEKYYYSFIRELEDPYIISFARGDLEKLRDEFFSFNEISNEDLSRIEKDFKSRMQGVLDNAKEAYKEYKLKKEKEVEKTILTEKLSDISSELSNMKTESKESLEKKEKLLEEIENTKNSLNNDIDIDKIKNEIETLDNESNDLLISEETRREVVKSIIRTLKNNDFKVEHPELIADENGGVVRIIAKKPSGKRSVCEVGLNGKLKYLFDNYEGLTCVNDINKFESDLESIYSIKLSDKIQTWENPDRISKGAIDINNTDKRTL